MSDYTAKLRHKKNIFGCIDYLVWLLTPLILFILALSALNGHGSILSLFSEHVQATIMSFSLTAVIGTICAIVVKDKIRPFLSAVSVILAAALCGTTGMFIVFGIELFEEYILHNIYMHYKNKFIINKEIDKRTEGNK